MFRKRIKQIFEPYMGIPIVKYAPNVNFFGQESKGLGQVRGNGSLILTDSELYFEMWWPNRSLRIPRQIITKIETPKWHLKKTKGTPLLKVYFINNQGKQDSAAWIVPDLQNWVSILIGKF
ncbi:MAG: hypothetical protein JW776_15815 [Candidatus Lokiarchaeota archaeon]|nr:hypothetical protein [Candidatus Lokiarchaeota archaeon]